MKNLCGLLCVMLLILLTSCSSTEQTQTNQNENENEPDKKEEKQAKDQSVEEQNLEEEKPIEVDKGVLNVEVTLPASLFQGEDLDRVIAEAKAAGIGEVSKNSDGSITYRMSKAKHKEMMMQMEKDLIRSIEEMKNNADLVSVQDITHNQSFSEFTLVVDKEAYKNGFDGFAVLGLGISGMFYGILNGVDPDDNKIIIFVVDEATQEVFEEMVYPDDLENLTNLSDLME
jgi:Adhesin P1 N-terminal domain